MWPLGAQSGCQSTHLHANLAFSQGPGPVAVVQPKAVVDPAPTLHSLSPPPPSSIGPPLPSRPHGGHTHMAPHLFYRSLGLLSNNCTLTQQLPLCKFPLGSGEIATTFGPQPQAPLSCGWGCSQRQHSCGIVPSFLPQTQRGSPWHSPPWASPLFI